MLETVESIIPAEFSEIPPYGPFGELVAPIYGCLREGIPVMGIRIERKHANRSDRFMHGGMVSTLADNAMIWGIRQLHPDKAPYVTTNLSVDFIGAIDTWKSDWMEARVTYVKHGRKLHFAECFLYVEEQVVARANGQFMVIDNTR